jgi:hypothetical protein
MAVGHESKACAYRRMLPSAVDVALDGDFQIVDDGRAVEGRFDGGERCPERGARAGSGLHLLRAGQCRRGWPQSSSVTFLIHPVGALGFLLSREAKTICSPTMVLPAG